MSLLNWLGSKTEARSLSPITKPQAIRTVLGVLGTRSNVSLKELEEQVLGPILEAWGIPDSMLLMAEGDSSFALQAWAKQRGIPVQLAVCDWVKQGRRAGLLRDAMIQREATHIVLLQGPRSNALMTLARRLDRKGRAVVISERPGEMVKTVNS